MELFSFMEGHCRGEDMGEPGGDRIGVHDVKLSKNQWRKVKFKKRL